MKAFVIGKQKKPVHLYDKDGASFCGAGENVKRDFLTRATDIEIISCEECKKKFEKMNYTKVIHPRKIKIIGRRKILGKFFGAEDKIIIPNSVLSKIPKEVNFIVRDESGLYGFIGKPKKYFNDGYFCWDDPQNTTIYVIENEDFLSEFEPKKAVVQIVK